jgi:membrane fusion protein (multidrug efflux system)
MTTESEGDKTRTETPPSGELGFMLPEPAEVSRRKALAAAALVLLALGAAFLARFLPRHSAKKELTARAEAAKNAVPRVVVVTPELVSSERHLKLPASIQPLEEAVIYPRANGFVARWLVDLGDRVKADQLLAEIETPELDQELSQARATLARARAVKVQTEANRALAIRRFIRTGRLTEAGVASQAELEQTQAEASVGDANVNVAEANIAAEIANVKRLTDLLKFAKVTAPFAGTVTARYVDRGSLVTAGNTTPLFRIAATETVRVFVQLPQDVAPSVTLDAPAKVTVREFPDRTFEGVISRTAGALDPVTRTLNTEIRIPNHDGKLLGPPQRRAGPPSGARRARRQDPPPTGDHRARSRCHASDFERPPRRRAPGSGRSSRPRRGRARGAGRAEAARASVRERSGPVSTPSWLEKVRRVRFERESEERAV